MVSFEGEIRTIPAPAKAWVLAPSKKKIHLFYKIDFKTTNNIADYEALLLGVKAAKEMGIMCMRIFGDADLII